jgi:hypothetical protein
LTWGVGNLEWGGYGEGMGRGWGGDGEGMGRGRVGGRGWGGGGQFESNLGPRWTGSHHAKGGFPSK